MRIAHVAPLYERVPPKLYGGTERVVSHLVEEQVRRGHEVTLFASGDSRTSAALVASVPRALRLDHSVTDPLAPHIVELTNVFERAAEFDLIHCHVDYLGFPFSRLTDVWPHDTAIAAAGLRRYGFTGAFLSLAAGLFDAAQHCEGHRLPELFCGFPRASGYGPTPYPVACSPQAWAAGVVSQLLAGMLGIEPDAEKNRLTFRDPVLPEWLPRVEVRGLRIRDSTLDVLAVRTAEGAVVEVLEQRGDAEIALEG